MKKIEKKMIKNLKKNEKIEKQGLRTATLRNRSFVGGLRTTKFENFEKTCCF